MTGWLTHIPLTEGDVVYLRLGDPVRQSRDYVTGRRLAGMSVIKTVAKAAEKGWRFRVLDRLVNATILFESDRPLYIMTGGEEVGVGPDGETLVRGAKALAKIHKGLTRFWLGRYVDWE